MVTVVDLTAEFAKLTMLKGRTPSSSETEREGAFGRVAAYRDGAIFTARFAGRSAWERHPQGDEIVQIVDGATTLHLMTAEGRQSLSLGAGMLAVVPQNTWHQFEAPEGVCVMTATPQPTEHLTVDVEGPPDDGLTRMRRAVDASWSGSTRPSAHLCQSIQRVGRAEQRCTFPPYGG